MESRDHWLRRGVIRQSMSFKISITEDAERQFRSLTARDQRILACLRDSVPIDARANHANESDQTPTTQSFCGV